MIKKTKKNKSSFFTFFIICFVVAVFSLMAIKLVQSPKSSELTQKPIQPSPQFNFGTQKITLDSQLLTFVDGQYSSASAQGGNITAHIFDRSVNSSLTKAAAILVYNPGGSGSFYYVVGASIKSGQEKYSQPVLLGDRIKIESIKVSEDDTIQVEYLDRSKNEPMFNEPTKKISSEFAFQDDGNLIPVIQKK